MKADWVAASVRARSMAQRRSGAGTARAIAALPTLESAVAALHGSSYADRLSGTAGLGAAERAIQEAVLWQLRVLAGWLPASGTALARAAAGTFEIENITGLARRLADGTLSGEPFQLGALATAWTRVREAASADELVSVLRTTAWGDVGTAQSGTLRDALTVSWARRLAAVAPSARPWCDAVCVLTAARALMVDSHLPSAPVLHHLRPVLGSAWESASTLAGFSDALPPSLRKVVLGIDSPQELWRAEARLRASVQAAGFRLLRASMPGPDVVLGAIAILSVDAWRLCAALAAAAAGAGGSEVLDAAA
ncbi:hypothetical protein KIH31_08000 [Paenarthrobacter sp. DKR-5]|uniref:hypothetical protein n=1 Tax=Paenarthrobacter sp. DKR-5 TaxID=2835535 RepID=UPI001BDC9229|nr:hypothetical protein [Paenarthrobacter sp. DKR-5]MBT1002545.1 hypothetical protein [Paenarthrobacter sp. DKR-5]